MATRRLAKPRPVQGEQAPSRRPAEEPGSRTERWSPETESGLQACYWKSPDTGALPIIGPMLSRERYVAVLDQAKTRGFEFVRFQDFVPGARALPHPASPELVGPSSAAAS